MKCKKCKREIAEGSTFCNWCGKKQVTDKQRGEISVPEPRPLSSGKCFIQLRIKGQSISITEDTPELCRTKARAIKSGLIQEKPKLENITLGALIDRYIEDRSNILSPASVDSYKRKRKNNFQTLMPKKIAEIDVAVMRSAVNAECLKYAPKTVRAAYGLITAALGRQFEDIALPNKVKKIPPVYSSEQIKKFLIAIDEQGEIECAALLAMWLSLRRSEILALKWEDIGADSITVKSALVYDEYHKLVEKPPKTFKSTRVIPCPKYILDKINALPKTGERVFTKSTSYLWERLNTICKNNDLPHMYMHGLRHTNATVMGLLGIADKYAMKRGGWSTDTVMKNVYQQIMDEGEKNAASAIDTYFLGLLNGENANKNANS